MIKHKTLSLRACVLCHSSFGRRRPLPHTSALESMQAGHFLSIETDIHKRIYVCSQSLSYRANNDPVMNESKGERHTRTSTLGWVYSWEDPNPTRTVTKESQKFISALGFWRNARKHFPSSRSRFPWSNSRQTWAHCKQITAASVILSYFFVHLLLAAHGGRRKILFRSPPAWPKVPMIYTALFFALR